MDSRLTLPERFAVAISSAIAAWCLADIRWGRDDCLMALAAVVEAVDGRDLAKPYRGRYRSAKGAIRVLGRGGVPGALAKAARRLDWRRMAPAACQDGAFGFIETPDGPAGVIRYGQRWLGRVPFGFSAYASDQVIRAWGYE